MRNTLRVRAASLLAALVLLAAASSCSWVKEKVESVSKDQQIAAQAVTQFHTQFNEGQYREIYAEAHEEFRKNISEADFIAALEEMNRKLGKVRATSTTNFRLSYQLGSKTATITCETEFTEFTEGKASEEFTWGLGDGQARLRSWKIE